MSNINLKSEMRKILLIDDEEGIRTVFPRFHDLTDAVFRGQLDMDTASDLEQGKARMSGTEYDAIIMDLKYKGHGSEVTITFIAESADHLPPIIVLTGDTDIYVRRRCMLAGASDFWLKDDAATRPDLFFKAIYNRYLTRYASRHGLNPA
jgi:CheY-like chemotaxis protein